ncbi:MAG TPA: lytic transglycosylase domain-containing protein, partial [Myxococcota bacterium]|nr:lytic transglycosylase domain-containing protein [Myxococcota bacterium]
MKKRRALLGLLGAWALLTTSIGSWSAEPDRAAPRDVAGLASGEAASAERETPRARAADATGPPGPDAAAPLAPDVGPTDPEVSQILARLSARHTALPGRERLALAHTIVREARAQGLEPDLVIAVIEVESAGYHLAVSRVGAMGLMQLLPSTAREVAGKIGVDWHGDDTLFDPRVNVKLGTAYLRELADRYGDVTIALAAYNWGPG